MSLTDWRHWVQVTLKGGLCLMLCSLLSSCVAQQADLERFQKTFDNRILQLDQEKKALQESVRQAEGMLAKQKAELEELVKARAQIKSELRNLREENITSLSGELETESYRIDQLNQRLDDLKTELANVSQAMEQRDAQRGASIQELETALTTKIQQQDKAVQQSLKAFSQSLGGFKQALDGLRGQLDKEAQRAAQAEAAIQQEVDGKQTAFEQKLHQDTEALRTYIDQDVTTSLKSLADSLKGTSARVDSRMQNFTLELEELKSQLDQKIQGVTQVLQGTSNDLQATQGTVAELKQVVETSLGQLGETVDSHTRQLSALEAHVTQLDGATKKVAKETADNHAQLQELNQSLVQLHQTLEQTTLKISREVDTHSGQIRSIQDFLTNLQARDLQFEKDSLETHQRLQNLTQSIAQIHQVLNETGTTIGQRVDQLAKVSEEVEQRLSQMEAHEASLTQKLEADTQALRTYVEQNVKTSLAAVGKELEALRLQVDQEVEQLRQESQVVQGDNQQMVKQVQENTRHMQEMSQSVAQLQEAFNAVGGMLGQRVDSQIQTLGQLAERLERLERDQSAIKEKLNADTQVTSTHLSQVNASIKSVSDAVTQVEQALGTRIGELERRLGESQPGTADMKAIQQEMAATVQHVNQLTDTVSQLREAVKSIGTKIGARVDQQAQHLSELAKQFNRLQGKKQ